MLRIEVVTITIFFSIIIRRTSSRKRYRYGYFAQLFWFINLRKTDLYSEKGKSGSEGGLGQVHTNDSLSYWKGNRSTQAFNSCASAYVFLKESIRPGWNGTGETYS